jgi:DNA-binding response OmpR family regulator
MANVLIVDDELNIKIILTQLLTTMGHQVVCATNGIEAQKILEKQTFDLVITDIIMPDMDGYELIRKLRKQSDSPKIIAISGGTFSQNSTELLKTALLMKADKILQKPFDLVSINAAVTELLGTGVGSGIKLDEPEQSLI